MTFVNRLKKNCNTASCPQASESVIAKIKKKKKTFGFGIIFLRKTMVLEYNYVISSLCLRKVLHEYIP